MRYTFHHTCTAEIDHVAQLLSQLEWFAAHNYTVSLPDGITASSTRNAITSAVTREFSKYHQMFRTYQRSCQSALKNNHAAINDFFALFDYPLPETIAVHCTAYGPGGSYTPPDTIVVTLSHTEGDPLQLIIHESIHLILEKPFIQKYALAHWEKEYIVDHLCKQSGIANFAHAYTIQKHGTSPSPDVIERLRFSHKHLIVQ
jgi:hypothetical protein